MFPLPTYLDRKQAAEALTAEGIKATHQTLADMAYRGVGPRYVTINGRALYKRDWLLAWIDAQIEDQAKPERRRRGDRQQPAA